MNWSRFKLNRFMGYGLSLGFVLALFIDLLRLGLILQVVLLFVHLLMSNKCIFTIGCINTHILITQS